MRIPLTEHELTELFRQLGASTPEAWAHSQVREGIPQLQCFLFLRYAWQRVIADGAVEWIDREIERATAHPNLPHAGLGLALVRCKAAGALLKDLTEIGRGLQLQMLHSVLYLIDGPPAGTDPTTGISWGLFETDEAGQPVGPQIRCLYESLLETEPAGRELGAGGSG
jgi:hypothetical protein